MNYELSNDISSIKKLIFFTGICTLISVLNFFAEMVINDWKNKPGVRTIYALTMFTFIVSLGGLSLFPHQGNLLRGIINWSAAA